MLNLQSDYAFIAYPFSVQLPSTKISHINNISNSSNTSDTIGGEDFVCSIARFGTYQLIAKLSERSMTIAKSARVLGQAV